MSDHNKSNSDTHRFKPDLSVDAVLRGLIGQMQAFLGAEVTITTMIFDDVTQTLQPGPGSEAFSDHILVSIQNLPIGAGCCGRAAQTRQVVVVEDIYATDLWSPVVLEPELNVRSCWAVPIVIDERVFGTFTIFAQEEGSPSERDVSTARYMAQHAAVALSRIKLMLENQRLATAVAHLTAGVVICDPHAPGMPTVFVNPAFTRLTGYEAHEVLGRNMRFLQGPNTDPEPLAQIQKALTCRESVTVEMINYRVDGTEYWSETSINPVFDDQGGLLFYIGLFADVTERKRTEEKIRRLAFYDALTGLPNRVKFEEAMREELVRMREEGLEGALLIVDIDRFKVINDSLGHSCGDELLIAIAQRLQGFAGEGWEVARLGGDEFVLSVPGENLGDLFQAAQELLDEIRRPLILAGRELSVTATIGLSLFPAHGENLETLIKHANVALYSAKENGKNSYQCYTMSMPAGTVQHLELENDLRKALDSGQLILHYQPQANIQTGCVLGVEALVRWMHPVRGMVPPGDFIPLAEESGLIVPIGEWVLKEACRQNKRWQEAGYPAMRVAVNLSAKQFLNKNIVETVWAALLESGLSPECLELEITESTAMQNPEYFLKILQELADLGVQISMDDFGTGYSSLSRLRRLPVNRLKIDRSFVRDVTVDAGDAAIVAAIIAMAHSLHLEVIAEGVETYEQVEYLLGQNCQEIQGFLFSRPLPVGEVEYLFDRS